MARGKLEKLAATAAAALTAENALRVASVSATEAASPGLYAFHASADTWRSLESGPPPDRRPLYVGKAEESLAARDLQGHFGIRPRRSQSPTGSSSLRRSLAALLAPSHGYVGMPRNPTNPGHYANFGLADEHDADLSAWMRRRLRIALWPYPRSDELDRIETLVLEQLCPPLNLDKVVTPWRRQVKTARKRLADDARNNNK